MENCTPLSTPMVKESSSEKTNAEQSNKILLYREAVGALMYLMLGTRLVIAYCVCILSRRPEISSKEEFVKVNRAF